MAVFSFSFPKLKLGHREKQGRHFETALFLIGHVFEVAFFLSGDVFDLGIFPARQGNISGELSGSYLKLWRNGKSFTLPSHGKKRGRVIQNIVVVYARSVYPKESSRPGRSSTTSGTSTQQTLMIHPLRCRSTISNCFVVIATGNSTGHHGATR